MTQNHCPKCKCNWMGGKICPNCEGDLAPGAAPARPTDADSLYPAGSVSAVAWLSEQETALRIAKRQVEYYTRKPDEYCSRQMWLIEVGRLERAIEAERRRSPSAPVRDGADVILLMKTEPTSEQPETAVPCTGWVEEGAAYDYAADDQIKLGWDELRGMQERARHYANLPTATKGERRMAANLLKCCEWIEAEGRAVESERRNSSTDGGEPQSRAEKTP